MLPSYRASSPTAQDASALPVAWSADPFHDRNWRAQLHMFRMTEGHLISFEKTGDARFLRWPKSMCASSCTSFRSG